MDNFFAWIASHLIDILEFVSLRVMSIKLLNVPILYWLLVIYILTTFASLITSFVPQSPGMTDEIKRVRMRGTSRKDTSKKDTSN